MLIFMMVPRGMVGVTVVVTRSERGATCTSFVFLKYTRKYEKCSVFWFLRQGFLEPNYLLCFRFRQIKIRETNRLFQPLKVRHKVPNDFMFWLILSWHPITYVSRGVQCRGQQRGRKAEDWRKMNGCSGSADWSLPCPSQIHPGQKN